MCDPIKVARMHGELWVVDGRHRIEAYELNDIKEVEVEIVEVRNEVDLIAEAYKANVGGALPPRKQDTEHTVVLLLEHDVAQKQIADLLGLPLSLTRSYVHSVQFKMARAQIQRAAQAVIDDGLSIAEAVKVHKVDVEKLKEVLSGRRRKHRAGIVDTRRVLTKLYKSIGSKNAALFRKLLMDYEDGDVTKPQMQEVFGHIETLQKRAARAVADWKHRFESKNGKPEARTT